MKTPLISIIIPVYNRADIIPKTIDSILSQTNPNWECIVVDDGSTDNTWSVLASYAKNEARISIFKRDREPKGAPACRNIGAARAKGDFLMFLDSDDYLTDKCIENRLATTLHDLENDFWVYPMAIKYYNNPILGRVIPEKPCYLDDFLSYNLYWGTMCVLWKKESFFLIKGYSENYLRLNDPELMIRAMLLPEIKYKVFTDMPYDSVYVLTERPPYSYKDNVFKSLQVFIPDVVSLLKKYNKPEKISLLSSYYSTWLNIFFALNSVRIKQTISITLLFYRYKIISLKRVLFNINSLFIYATGLFIMKKAKSLLKAK